VHGYSARQRQLGELSIATLLAFFRWAQMGCLF